MPSTMGLYNDADTTFLEGFAIPYKSDHPSAVDYGDVLEAFCMIQAALSAKTGVTERLQEENVRLQQQVEALQGQLSQATVAELDCGSLREEIERLMQVKSEISQEKAEVLRANQLLRQERDLACEQLEDFDAEPRLCAACDDRISLAEKCQRLEKQATDIADENTRLRQQLQHFREFYKKSKQNWQSEQALLLQVIQLQSKTCDHLMQPSRTSSVMSTPKTLSTPSTPKFTISSSKTEETPSRSPYTTTPTTTPSATAKFSERNPAQLTPSTTSTTAPPPEHTRGQPASSTTSLPTPFSEHTPAQPTPSTPSSATPFPLRTPAQRTPSTTSTAAPCTEHTPAQPARSTASSAAPPSTPSTAAPFPERPPPQPVPSTLLHLRHDQPTSSTLSSPPATSTQPTKTDYTDYAPSTSSSMRSVHTQLLSPSSSLSDSPSPSNVVHKTLRRVHVPTSPQPNSQQPSPEPPLDPPSNPSPGLQDTYISPVGSLSSPPSLGNRLLQRQPSDVGWRMPKVVSTFGLGAAPEASKGDSAVKGSKVASIIRSLSTTEQSPPLKMSPVSKKPAPRIASMINSITSPRGDQFMGGINTAPVRQSSAPASINEDVADGQQEESTNEACNTMRVSSIPTKC